MRKHFEPASFSFEKDIHSWLVVVEISSRQWADWSACLCLLHFDLIEYVELHSTRSKLILHLCKDANLSSSQRGYCRMEKGRAILSLSSTELDYWTHFFLKAYRNGFADVDHIDLEVELRGAAPGIFSLLLMTELARPPEAAEELRDRFKA